ncbi:Mpo1 family 2-hydroxy fatty acid dioxygenase [Legionella jordanis]|uniref:Transmembrane protein n=1 Tax=Legionella jordanis TaxID=456 RepID=A0A0W0VCM0_9GAMM|nr:Mpo1-like protein [Legionella jordanis]KTD17856.1 transmembrane protein [Legionella jordanis]RMX02445.1 DUF962 domain-containing protein [Legionella jordanis]RMX21712.1 DUF962 domain-containing protein [Legionella jordanis]VEH11207.1 transmembrane protein [Legionella jordanis]HAT8713825.1 DUF962 domain-containing protein [Legionella jordanis]
MKSFIEQAQFYSEYHQKPVTFYSHMIGIPLIIFSLMVFFGFFHLIIPGVMDAKFSDIATVLILIYYILLNWRLGLVLIPIFILFLWIADLISWAGPTRGALWTFAVCFIVGWVFQFIGHFMEGRRPALADNFWQALIAPLYLTAELFFKAGRMENLKRKIHGEPISPIVQNSTITSPPPRSNDDIM